MNSKVASTSRSSNLCGTSLRAMEASSILDERCPRRPPDKGFPNKEEEHVTSVGYSRRIMSDSETEWAESERTFELDLADEVFERADPADMMDGGAP